MKNYESENYENKYNNQNAYESDDGQRNENILCAVLALLKELDNNSLEFVRREVEKRLER